MAGLGSLYIDLLARTGKFETDIGRAARMAEKRAKEIDKSFSRLGSRILGGLGGLVAGFSLSAIIDETANAERALAALDNAVKNNGGSAGFTTQELANLSSELQKVTTYGDDAIQEMQALLLTFREIRGTEFTRAQTAVLDLATALGKDLRSSAMLVGRALADPERGVKQLARAGVILSDEQKKLAKQLAETGRMSEAQGLLLRELESRFGGAAEAARDSFGGAIQGLKNAFSDLLEQKGGLPKLTRAINEMADTLGDSKTRDNIDTLSDVLVDLLDVVNKVGGWFNTPKRVAWQWFLDFLQDGIDKAKTLKETLADRTLAQNIQLMFFGQRRSANFEPAGPTVPKTEDPPQIAPTEEFTKLADKLEEQIALYGKVGKATEISYAIQSGALDELTKSEQQQLLALARRYDAVVVAADAQKKLTEEQKKAVEEVSKMTQSLEEQIATFGMGETATLAYRVAHGDLAKAFELAGENGEAMKQKLLDLTRELEIMTEAAEKATEAMAEFARQNSESLDASLDAFETDFEARFMKGGEALTVFVEEAARGTQDIIADSLISGFDRGAKGILQSFGQLIVKITAEIVAADLTARLFSGLASLGAGGAAGSFGALFGGARAIGGPVLAGMTYRVNEREPEFFRPRVGGDVIPLSKMPNMGGGMVLNQNFTVRPETGERVSRRTEQQIAAAASRGMAMASRRNN